MKLPQPDHLNIGCHTYTVEVADFVDMHDDSLKAEVNWRLKRIRIQVSRPNSEKFVSLLHEAIHIANSHFNKGTPELSERQVNVIAEGMAQMLQSIGFDIEWSTAGESETVLKEGSDA